MSKKTGYLLGMLLTMIICMILAYFFCCGAGAAADDAITDRPREASAANAATSMPFDLKGPDGNFAFNSNDNFNFNTSRFEILTPLSTKLDEGVAKLKDYFSAGGNANKHIDITGYYDSDEENTSAFENLGLARANAVKNYFVNQGIDSKRMNTFGKLRESMVPKDNTYFGPVSYRLFAQAEADKAAQDAALEEVAETIKAKPLTLYFDTAAASVNLTAAERQQMGDISRYLDKVDGATISVVGHTDSEGPSASNVRLGQGRADFAKQYLVRNGIATSKIKTSSKGESQPVTTNDTKEGRAKNRRSVITIN